MLISFVIPVDFLSHFHLGNLKGGDKMVYYDLYYKYNCKNCRLRKYKYCDIYSEAMESAKRSLVVKRRGMLLDQTKEEYHKEVRELEDKWWGKRNRMYRCINRRIYLQLNKEYRLFFV